MKTSATLTLTVETERGSTQEVTVHREHDGGGDPAFIQYELDQDIRAANWDGRLALLTAVHQETQMPARRPINPANPIHLLDALVNETSLMHSEVERGKHPPREGETDFDRIIAWLKQYRYTTTVQQLLNARASGEL